MLENHLVEVGIGKVQGFRVLDRATSFGVAGGADLECRLTHGHLLVERFGVGVGEECRAGAYAGMLNGVGGVGKLVEGA